MILEYFCVLDVPEGSYDTEYLAVQIETAIFNVFMNSGPNYKQRVRTRVMNLRDTNNVELRLNVLAGSVSAEKLAVMSSEVIFIVGIDSLDIVFVLSKNDSVVFFLKIYF